MILLILRYDVKTRYDFTFLGLITQLVFTGNKRSHFTLYIFNKLKYEKLFKTPILRYHGLQDFQFLTSGDLRSFLTLHQNSGDYWSIQYGSTSMQRMKIICYPSRVILVAGFLEFDLCMVTADCTASTKSNGEFHIDMTNSHITDDKYPIIPSSRYCGVYCLTSAVSR